MAFNHKRADFWFPNFGFKRSLLSLLKRCFIYCSSRKRHNQADFMHNKETTFPTKEKIGIHLEELK